MLRAAVSRSIRVASSPVATRLYSVETALPLQIMQLPVFPLPHVVYPREQAKLNIFEPRYRLLVDELLETDGKFGLAKLSDETPEDGSITSWRSATVGTIAQLCGYERRGDHLVIHVEGLSRFAVQDPLRDRHGLWRVDALPYDDCPLEEDAARQASRQALVVKSFLLSYVEMKTDTAFSAKAIQRRQFEDRLEYMFKQGPSVFSLWAAMQLRGLVSPESSVPQALLASESVNERLSIIGDQLKSILDDQMELDRVAARFQNGDYIAMQGGQDMVF